jgi:hypothetical protein
MRRAPLKRSTLPMRRGAPLRVTRRPLDYDAEVWRAGLGPCVITGATVGVDPHHVIYAQTLRKHGLHAFLTDHRNRLPVRRDKHLNHHSGVQPISRELLLPAVFEFAAEVGLLWWLDRHYPAVSERAA